MKITQHAYDRGEERCGLNLKSFRKLAEKALHEGIKHSDTTGQLKKYFDALYFQHRNANNVRVYGEFTYLFCNERLITVLHLPNQFKKIVQKIRSRCEL